MKEEQRDPCKSSTLSFSNFRLMTERSGRHCFDYRVIHATATMILVQLQKDSSKSTASVEIFILKLYDEQFCLFLFKYCKLRYFIFILQYYYIFIHIYVIIV